nr:polysaccharide pyruvyl transferase family protein [Clostridium paraputrificum]
MKKVAIVSCYFMKNYGSVLQAYATQKILDEFRVENETICIEGLQDKIKKQKIRYFLSKINDIDVIFNKLTFLKHSLAVKFNINDLKNNMRVRNNAFDKFNSVFKVSPQYTFTELAEASDRYSSVIVGSDQLWLPSNIYADYYTLNWVKDEVNKISYATSFGVSDLEEKYQRLAEKFLKRINYLSVREQAGQKLIKDITGREAQIVCDPTLLFDKNEWEDIQKNKDKVKGKYIFCYFIGNNPEQRKFVKKLKSITGYKIVALQHIDEYIKSDEGFADESPYDVEPGDFITLIKNAEYVCTDSFHGTVFSIINEKSFFTFRRFNSKRKVSTNSRLDSLLNLLDLKERLLNAEEIVEDCIKMKIDYNEVNQKLNDFRKESKKFLKEALKIK